MQFYHLILALMAVAYLNEAVSADGDYTDSESVAFCTKVNQEIEAKLKASADGSQIGFGYSRRGVPNNQIIFKEMAKNFRDSEGSSSGNEIKNHLFNLSVGDCTREGFEHAKASLECTQLDWRATNGCMGGAKFQCSPLQSVVAGMVFLRAFGCQSKYMDEYKAMAKEMDKKMIHFMHTLGVAFKGECDMEESSSRTRYLIRERDYHECMEDNIKIIRAPILASAPGEKDTVKLAQKAIDQCNIFIAKFSDLIGRVRWEWPIYNSLINQKGLIGVWRAYYACRALIAQPMNKIVDALAT